MDLVFKEGQEMKEFLSQNKQIFEDMLLAEAVNVREKIKEIHLIGNINLLLNAHRLVLYVVENREQELIAFAKQEGILWAKYSLTLEFKLEWVQAIRRTLWNFLYHYDHIQGKHVTREEFYAMEKRINELVDQFLNNFFISYSAYKDKLIESQKKLVHNLSVPIIPISPSICILPLIGEIDAYRAKIIEEKVLMEIGNLHIQTLIMDLSGVLQMEMEVAHHLLRIFDGISMMGCSTIITGLRPEVVRKMINEGISFKDRAEMKGTLQQALKNYLAM
ncbi:STAS domain-containing protein [Aneurinibacillus sp. REN35]|uniref:STAS domain-containing protein n=1 Tax=Aneurinibacillus sp. REN35 TaxID=3237286 RepID=UPI003526DAE4